MCLSVECTPSRGTLGARDLFHVVIINVMNVYAYIESRGSCEGGFGEGE